MPQSYREKLEMEDRNLNKILKYYGSEYIGTDSIKDQTYLYEEARKKEYSIQLQNGILKKEKVGAESKQDPYDVFGHGVQAYFRMLKMHIFAFFVISICFVPTMNIYSQGGAFDGFPVMGAFLSLGNLGHAGAACVHEFIEKELPQKLECRQGKISHLVHYGLMPTFDESQTFHYDTCADHSTIPEIKTCTEMFVNSAEMIEDFNEICAGNNHCDFDMKLYLKKDYEKEIHS